MRSSSPEHLKHNTQYGRVVCKEMWSGSGEDSSPHPKDRETLPEDHPILHPTMQVRSWNTAASSSADDPTHGALYISPDSQNNHSLLPFALQEDLIPE